MTTICAVKDPETGTVWLGSNSQHCRGDERVPSTQSKWDRMGQWAIANAGSTKHAYVVKTDELLKKSEPLTLVEFVSRLRKIFIDNEIRAPDDDQDGVSTDFGAYFVLAHETGVYGLDRMLTPHKIDDGEIWANGSGCDYARGAFLAARSLGQSIEDSLRIAVEIAISCDRGSPGSAIIEQL